jgi:hypothetical protein
LSFDDVFLQPFDTERIASTGSIDDAVTVTWTSVLFLGQLVDNYRMEECFMILQKYSFVQWKADQHSYVLHKLVHAWGYDRLPGDEQYRFSVATFMLVIEAMNGREMRQRTGSGWYRISWQTSQQWLVSVFSSFAWSQYTNEYPLLDLSMKCVLSCVLPIPPIPLSDTTFCRLGRSASHVCSCSSSSSWPMKSSQ